MFRLTWTVGLEPCFPGCALEIERAGQRGDELPCVCEVTWNSPGLWPGPITAVSGAPSQPLRPCQALPMGSSGPGPGSGWEAWLSAPPSPLGAPWPCASLWATASSVCKMARLGQAYAPPLLHFRNHRRSLLKTDFSSPTPGTSY